MLLRSIGDDGIDTSSGLLHRVSFNDGSTRLMRDLRLLFRLCHAWFDVETQQIVGLTWLCTPGDSGPKRMCFSDLGNDTRAFGGAIATKFEWALCLGDAVSWANWSGGQWRVKTGAVEEIVSAGCLPDQARFPQLFRSSGVGSPRNHKSFVVRVPGAKAKSAGKVYWPRVTSFTKT